MRAGDRGSEDQTGGPRQAARLSREPWQGSAGSISPLIASRIKGIAILLMLAHHLFGLPGLIRPPSAVIPIFSGVPLEYLVGRFGKVCVPIFLLLSGYGLGTASLRAGAGKARYFFGKAWRFYGHYLYYLGLVAVLLLFILPLPGADESQVLAIQERLGWPAIFALGKPVIYEWWFAQVYLALLLLSPAVLRAVKRPWLLGAFCLGAFCAGAAMDAAHVRTGLFSLSNLLIWQLPYCLGLLVSQRGISPRPFAFMNRQAAVVSGLIVLAGFAVIEAWLPLAMTPFLIVASPLLIAPLVRVTDRSDGSWQRALGWLGERSLPIWLIHPFLCTYLAQGWIYAPGLSVAVFASLLGATLWLVLAFEVLRRALAQGYDFATQSIGSVLVRPDRDVLAQQFLHIDPLHENEDRDGQR